MTTKTSIGQQYFELLQKADLEGLASIFAEDGIVVSPLYGIKGHRAFYKGLQEDTNQSIITLKETFQGTSENTIAILFEYDWTLSDGKRVVFEGVDIFEFNEENKIVKLTIIYDTVQARGMVENLQ